MDFAITESHETETHKRSSHNARSKWRTANPAETRYNSVPTVFVCIDGEGVTLPDGSHRYVLLGVGDSQISNGEGLSFEEIFGFLWEQFNEHGTKSVAYVGFFLGYDFVQWLKTLPEERARMLLTQEGRNKRKPKSDKRPHPFPVQYGEWEFDILGTKRLKLRKIGSKRWMNICDAGPFFQKSFLKVIDPKEWSEPVVTEEEYATIQKGKSKRASATLDKDMARYNALENDVLSRVLPRLNDGFQSLGIHLSPGQWFGPGQAAQAWLKDRAITSEKLQECTPQDVLEAARMSYYGGWFEITAHGLIRATTHEYDINSAYPYIISTLPCLEHGTWKHGEATGTASEQPLSLCYAKVQGSDRWIGAMLHRDEKGNIYRPHETEGWYWLHELEMAKRADLIHSCRISDTWTYHPCNCPPPLREVRDIYNLRKEVGKKTPLGIACKLVPNSLYGKFAQSIGSPKYGNPIYASLITSGCRTMILEAIATHPRRASGTLMVATDGVYFKEPHPSLPISDELGDWDHEEKQQICLFKPGVYWDNAARDKIKQGKAPVFKARGVPAADFGKKIKDVEALFEVQLLLSTLEFWPAVRFPVSFSMISAVQALHRNDWSLAGTLEAEPMVKASANPRLKRCNWRYERGMLRTEPRKNDPYESSHPYEKRFGMDDPFDDQNYSLSPDGWTGMAVMEALGMS